MILIRVVYLVAKVYIVDLEASWILPLALILACMLLSIYEIRPANYSPDLYWRRNVNLSIYKP